VAVADPILEKRSQTAPGLPSAPGEIGTLRRGPDGVLIHISPGEEVSAAPNPSPATPPENMPKAGIPRVLPPEKAARPPETDPLPGFRPPDAEKTPEVANPAFDPRPLQSLQDRALHRRRAASHQADIDRILKEESLAKDKGAPVDSRGLTARENALERELTRIDREVRDHETEHYRAGLPFSQLPEYWLVTGPLGKQYAVSGITPFDFTEVNGDPEATIRKYQRIRRAALAPRVPSQRDREIALELSRQIETLKRSQRASK
jgi:hypothetical protein